VADEADAPSRFAWLATDRPWSEDNDRRLLFFTSILTGLLAGALEGAAICNPELVGYSTEGDASFWDTVASGAAMGAAAGAAGGLALTATRNFWARVPLAALLGAVLVPAVLLLSSAGLPLGYWEGVGYRAGRTCLEKPLDWGLFLGSALAGTLALVAHLARGCIERPRFLFLAMVVGVALGARSQYFFWERWGPPPTLVLSSDELFFTTVLGGVLWGMTTVAAVLLLQRFGRRAGPRRLRRGLAGAIAALSLFLVWAVDAMPFTGASDVVDMTFHPDGDQLITAHAGNAIRVWDLPEDVRGGALPPKEIGRWRFTKRRNWHAPLTLRYPYAAAVVPGGIQVWQLPRMRELVFIKSEEEWRELAFSPDAGYLAVCRGEEARLFHLAWEEKTRRLKILEEFAVGGKPVRVLNGSIVGTLAVSNAGEVRLADHRHQNQTGPLHLQKESLYGTRPVVSLSDGTEILAARGINCSYLWNSGRVGGLMTFRPPMDAVEWALLSSDDRLLALIGGRDRWVVDVERGRVVLHDQKLADAPELLLSSPDGDWIAAVIRGRLETWKWPLVEAAR